VGRFSRSIQSHRFALVGAAGAAALAGACFRIRDRRVLRYGLLACGVAAAVVYGRAVATGNAEVDAVERVHFIQYGLVTFLFYRAFRGLDDIAIVLLPGLAGLAVATVDELFQWFIPARIGEMHDIFLNGAAIGSGLLFSLGIDPPARMRVALQRSSRRPAAVMASVAMVLFAIFMDAVHLGHRVGDPEDGQFLSAYDEAELRALAAERAARWRTDPPVRAPRIGREDHYLAEGFWHVQRRNQRWAEGDVTAAWRENLILERYFAPVLDTPSFGAASGARWPPGQRADAAARADPGAVPYISDAQPLPLYEWPRPLLWLITIAVVAMVVGCARA
jgi:hypothetical protein